MQVPTSGLSQLIEIVRKFLMPVDTPYLKLNISIIFQLSLWINEKMLTAQDMSYDEARNLHSKWLKHQAFMAELGSNKEWLDKIQKVWGTGRVLWERHLGLLVMSLQEHASIESCELVLRMWNYQVMANLS